MRTRCRRQKFFLNLVGCRRTDVQVRLNIHCGTFFSPPIHPTVKTQKRQLPFFFMTSSSTYTFPLCLFLAFISLLSCNDSERLRITKIYEKDYQATDKFFGEIYATANGDFYQDTTALKAACEKLLPSISKNCGEVKFHIQQNDKTVKRVIIDRIFSEYHFEDSDSANRRCAEAIKKLIQNNTITMPDNLIGIWNVHGWGFDVLYKHGDTLMIDTYHYNGVKQVNKHPEVTEVTIKGKKLLKHTWQSDLMGPDEKYFEINEFGDLVYYEPADFMQYIFEKITL